MAGASEIASSTRPARRRARPRGRAAGDTLWRNLTLAPALVLFGVLTVVPMVSLLLLSVHDVSWAGGKANWSYVGFRNFADLVGDTLFRASIVNTIIFAVVGVSLEMLLGLALALLTSEVAHGRAFYRAIFLLPILIPGIVIGAIWKLMYNFDFGVINELVAYLGIQPQDWLGQTNLALASVIVVDIWHWTPFCFLLLLAGIESLPQDVYEAVRLDGASRWQSLRHVTLPLLLPTIVVTFIFRLILAFKVFDEVYLLTGGGPGTSTEVVSFTIYRRFFTEDRAGYGSAMSLVTFLVIALLIILAIGFARRRGARA